MRNRKLSGTPRNECPEVDKRIGLNSLYPTRCASTLEKRVAAHPLHVHCPAPWIHPRVISRRDDMSWWTSITTLELTLSPSKGYDCQLTSSTVEPSLAADAAQQCGVPSLALLGSDGSYRPVAITGLTLDLALRVEEVFLSATLSSKPSRAAAQTTRSVISHQCHGPQQAGQKISKRLSRLQKSHHVPSAPHVSAVSTFYYAKSAGSRSDMPAAM